MAIRIELGIYLGGLTSSRPLQKLVFVAEGKYDARMSITQYFRDDLAAQLNSGWELPLPLNNDSLA